MPGYNWKPVAKYSNGSWSIVGAGDSNAGAYSTYSNLWVNNANDIYTTSGYSDSGVIRIKHWDGESWTVLYNNLEDEAERLSQSITGTDGSLYAYGVKKGSYTSCLTQWNGEYWETLGDIESDLNIHNFSLNGGIHYKYISENEIYAVGSKFRKSDTSIYMVVKWDGENWSEVGEINANKVVESLDVHNGFLYVSGSLTNSTNQTLVKRFFVGHSTQNFNIQATADPEDGGTITGSGVYTEGEEVTLTANANEGFVFVNWTKDGQEVSTFSEFSFEVLESSNFIAHFVIHELGINELNPATTNIFPNPFSNYLNIKTKNQSFQKIEILDSSGSLIFSRQLNPNSTKHSFNLEHLSSGLYFLRISNDSEKKVFKVIKK